MKSRLIGGDEYDLVSKWRKKGTITRKAGVWKYIKNKINRRIRKQKVELE